MLRNAISVGCDLGWCVPASKPATKRAKPRRHEHSPILDRTHADAATWAANASRLCRAILSLLNRPDACGGYRGATPTTRKDFDSDWLPMPESISAHCAKGRTIGLHAIAPSDGSCGWIAFDIDAHDGESVTANRETALTLAARLRVRKIKPFIFDSDGRGGFHVWGILPNRLPSQEAYALAAAISNGFAIESFPKQAEICPGGFGNWIRLPGLHHKRPHWSRIVDARTGATGTTEQTIEAIVEMNHA